MTPVGMPVLSTDKIWQRNSNQKSPLSSFLYQNHDSGEIIYPAYAPTYADV